MTPREEVEEFVAAVKASGFARANEMGDFLLQFYVCDNSLAIEAGDKIRAALRLKHLSLRERASRVATMLQQHIRTFPAEH